MRFEHDHSHQEVGTHSPVGRRRTVTTISVLFLIFGSVLLLVGAGDTADRDKDVASKIRSLEQLRFEAQQQRNIAALDTLLDEGLMWVDANGALSTKAGYLQGLHESSSSQLRVESMTVKVFDQMAIVVGIYDERGIKNNRPYRRRCRFIDTWSFKRAEWVVIAATATATIS